ncbi:unnamed protein product, partial [Discosporangium mesarthrocarpum]
MNGDPSGMPGGLVCSGFNRLPVGRVGITSVLATEDDLWSPVLGLKGVIDATVVAVLSMFGPGTGKPRPRNISG